MKSPLSNQHIIRFFMMFSFYFILTAQLSSTYAIYFVIISKRRKSKKKKSKLFVNFFDIFLGNGILWNTWNHLQLNHEVWCWHQERFVRQHSFIWRYHHVPRNCWSYAKRNHRLVHIYHISQRTEQNLEQGNQRIPKIILCSRRDSQLCEQVTGLFLHPLPHVNH